LPANLRHRGEAENFTAKAPKNAKREKTRPLAFFGALAAQKF
jgi:hypothetical protein